ALAPDDVAAEDLGQVEALLLLGRPGHEGGAGVAEADEAGVDARQSQPPVLLEPDQLLDERRPAAAVLLRPRDAGPPPFPLGLLPGQVELPHGLAVPGALLAGGMLGEPRPDLVTECDVIVREPEVHIRPRAAAVACRCDTSVRS